MEIIDFDAICRICWKSDGLKTVFNEDIPSLCEMLMACAPVEVCDENGLPTKLCVECSLELEMAYTFRHKCIQADFKMKKYLDDNGIETTVQYVHDPETDETIETIQTTVVYQPDKHGEDIKDGMYETTVEDTETFVIVPDNLKNDETAQYILKQSIHSEENDLLHSIDSPVEIYEVLTDDNMEEHDGVEEQYTVLPNKKYSCQLCDRAYSHPRNLKRHINVDHSGIAKEPMTGGRNFKCSICQRIFSYKNALIRHLRVVHREITQKYFKLKSGKNCCSREINVFIENTKESTTEVKGILGDLENQPEPVSDEEMYMINKDDYTTPPMDVKSKRRRRRQDYQHRTRETSPAYEEEILDVKEETDAENIETQTTNDLIKIENIDNFLDNNTDMQILQSNSNDMVFLVNQGIFDAEENSSSQLNTVAEKQPISCDFCSRKFNLRFNLKQHLKVVHDIVNKMKDQPDMHMPDSVMGQIMQEIKVEIDAINSSPTNDEEQKSADAGWEQKKYQCNLCEKSYFAKNNLHRHVKEKHLPKTVEPDRDYKCELCDRAFARKGLLERHKETHFERVTFQCEQCGDVFDKKVKLRLHVIKHDTQKKFQCDVCQKWFLRASTLKVHKRQHADVLPYPCPECDRAFSMRPALEAHIRTHSASRPYICEFCRRAFRHPGHLDTHMKLHTGERPFPCTMCVKRFTTSTHLKYHIKVHLDQRDHKCDVCGRAFIHSSELKYHLISHTQLKERPCPICGKLFARTNQVTKHMKQVHKIKKNFYA